MTKWHDLSLRVRILIGYTSVLAPACVLVLFLMLRIGQFYERISEINTRSAAQAEAGVQLVGRVAAAQQAADRYLQDPRAHNWRAALEALHQMDADIDSVVADAGDLDELRQRSDDYQRTFTELSQLIRQKETLRERLVLNVFQANSLAGSVIAASLATEQGGDETVQELIEAQQHLGEASLRISRLMSEQDPVHSEAILGQLRSAQELFSRSAARPDPPAEVEGALRATNTAIMLTERLAQTFDNLQTVREQQLSPQALLLSASANQIANRAMGRLTAATDELESLVEPTYQLASLGLVATIVGSLMVGLRLARHLSRPIVALAGAVERVNSGNYDVVAENRTGGELGRLTAAFNRMTATLRRQRDEVQAQQAAITERNAELEQALAQLQAAIAEREQLATAVRALSVPVVPILRHVIVVPLVGEIDAERAQVLMQRLLDGVEAEQARIVILDITGVPVVDAELAERLLQAATAAELLGARCVLVGISPEVAQALVTTGADLSRLVTHVDLRAGVEYAMRTLAAQQAPR